MNKIFTALFLLIIILSGCATYRVSVDSINGPESFAKTKYILFPGDKNVAPTDLQFQEYSRYVDRGLIIKGFTRAANFDDANLLVFIFYGISDPQSTQSAMVLPTWGQTGIASANTFGTLNTFGNRGTYQGTTTYKPSYGITGYQAIPVTNTSYSKMIILYAIDLKQYIETKNIAQLWKTTLTSIGTSGDLREVFPVMIAAAIPYLGTNTGRQIDVVLTEGDKAITDITGVENKVNNITLQPN